MKEPALALTALTAFALTAGMGIWMIPYLRKLKFGQTILDIGPKWHQHKQGTPTMGGVMFIIGITMASAIGYLNTALRDPSLQSPLSAVANARFFAGLIMSLAMAFMGFVDDYVKVAKKRNLGLTAGQKLLVQFAVAGFYLATLYLAGDRSTRLLIPFLGRWDIGPLYYPLAAVGIVYMVNSVNITDGVDGLAASVTLASALGYAGIFFVLGLESMQLLSVALAGGCLGFLCWNSHPAKVFMGDTGSMFLGGLVTALAFGAGMPLILIFTGFIYIVESMSVVLQVISFKTTGKRIFKMSPIHHHFEMSGWKERRIVTVFTAIAAMGSMLAVWAVALA
jgi:phospho-N-acetylmuramoyl-pentapeptide-transferase